jgi:3-hydroxyisobutyrate dehydrogenase-like beta-hydroxyacid dehydrogenase
MSTISVRLSRRLAESHRAKQQHYLAAPVYRNYGSMIASDKFEPAGFKLPLGLKDNRLLLAAAEEAMVPMPMASLVHDRFVAALAQGLGESDWAAIARISYKEAGLRQEVAE